MVFLALGKLRNEGILLTPLRNLQMRGAFIAAFKVKNDGWRSKQVYFTIAN